MVYNVAKVGLAVGPLKIQESRKSTRRNIFLENLKLDTPQNEILVCNRHG